MDSFVGMVEDGSEDCGCFPSLKTTQVYIIILISLSKSNESTVKHSYKISDPVL